MIIAVDFDGTVVDHRFPAVGPDVPLAVESLRQLVADGHQIILWTMRSGKFLEDAIEWYTGHEIPLYGVNNNPQQHEFTTSPKAYAQLYIDDAALGCPLIKLPEFNRRCVDWARVMELVEDSDAGQAKLTDGPEAVLVPFVGPQRFVEAQERKIRQEFDRLMGLPQTIETQIKLKRVLHQLLEQSSFIITSVYSETSVTSGEPLTSGGCTFELRYPIPRTKETDDARAM